ncbi:hypothetical protein OJ997_35425 [Solirubrobacter phytolaccae]|uniref:WxL domain-containing protein n=1 Tax=Solirubrobacter phytolaccae TaxID=1404360 RepID=A0A9X3NL94_9ACTN|nr:hypothetical protein [Solirubrobacter phytolaccae]MDA0185651.1 hypothetical protein [Solirubrobacter phytolaccae]
MKLATAIVLAATLVAAVLSLQPANAVDDAPNSRVQLIEVEQQTPYLESFAGVTAGTATTSIVRRVSGVTFSSQAYAQLDNHNGDQSRATFPIEVEAGDLYGIHAAFVKGPNFGVVQLELDGRPLGGPFDAYAAALGVEPAKLLGTVALAEGKHMLTMTVVGKNEASTDWLGGLDLLVLDSTAAAQPTPTAVATAEVGGSVPATLALSLGTPPRFEAFVPGTEREYTAQTQATVTSSAGDATLTTSDPGYLTNGAFKLAQPLKVTLSKTTWDAPTSGEPVDVTFKQAIGARDPLRTGTYAKTLTFTLSTTNP